MSDFDALSAQPPLYNYDVKGQRKTFKYERSLDAGELLAELTCTQYKHLFYQSIPSQLLGYALNGTLTADNDDVPPQQRTMLFLCEQCSGLCGRPDSEIH